MSLRRREFIALLGGAAWPIAARAQQAGMPVIGVLNGVSLAAREVQLAAFRQGLKSAGFAEGQNVQIEYRSAEGRYDRLPALAADLVDRQVAVIVAIGSMNSPLAARAATSTIPIVFAVGGDPVDGGLVTNLNRPGGNLTGVSYNVTTLAPKRLEIIREVLPAATSIGYLKNPTNTFDTDEAGLSAAAEKLGLQLSSFGASSDQDILSAFQSMAQQKIAALLLSTDASFNIWSSQIIALAARYAMPTIYVAKRWVVAGGFVSYGVENDSLYRQAGVYTGRILKGDRPADLPVVLPTKFQLVVNAKTAKMLGIELPLSMLMRVDEVIE